MYGTKVATIGRMIGFGIYSLIAGFCGLLLTTQIASGKSLDGDCNVESQAFPCIEAAVYVLSISYHQRSIREDREYIAAIFEENCAYRVTVQAGSPGEAKVRMKIRPKKSQTLVALWHTHGAPAPLSEWYSATDSKTVRTTGLPFYLTTPRGKIKVLDQSRVNLGRNSGTTICVSFPLSDTSCG